MPKLQRTRKRLVTTDLPFYAHCPWSVIGGFLGCIFSSGTLVWTDIGTIILRKLYKKVRVEPDSFNVISFSVLQFPVNGFKKQRIKTNIDFFFYFYEKQINLNPPP